MKTKSRRARYMPDGFFVSTNHLSKSPNSFRDEMKRVWTK